MFFKVLVPLSVSRQQFIGRSDYPGMVVAIDPVADKAVEGVVAVPAIDPVADKAVEVVVEVLAIAPVAGIPMVVGAAAIDQVAGRVVGEAADKTAALITVPGFARALEAVQANNIMLRDELNTQAAMIEELKREIEELKKPWYKRLFGKQ